MWAILYWQIGESRIEGPYETACAAKEAAEEFLREQDYWHAGVFELVDFLEVPKP